MTSIPPDISLSEGERAEVLKRFIREHEIPVGSPAQIETLVDVLLQDKKLCGKFLHYHPPLRLYSSVKEPYDIAAIVDGELNEVAAKRKEEAMQTTSGNGHAPVVRKHNAMHLRKSGEIREGDSPIDRWLLRQEYDYVISDEALTHNSLGDSFRSICLLCGVSTNVLAGYVGLSSTSWSKIQNNHYSGDPAPWVMRALSYIPDGRILAGRGHKSYLLPKGSLLGLPTITRPGVDGAVDTAIVDPAELERIHLALFKRPYRISAEQVEHTFKQLVHLSQAYRQGAVSTEELQSLHIPVSFLHPLVKRYGMDALYEPNSKEHKVLAGFLNDRNYTNIAPVVQTLMAINEAYWHIPAERFTAYMESLPCFPGLHSLLLKTLPPEEAFAFAQRHHKGKLGKFLAVYREAIGQPGNSVGKIMGRDPSRGSQLEKHPDDGIVRSYALDAANPWQLPANAQGIEPFVQLYLNNFEQHKGEALPEDYWSSKSEILPKLENQGEGESVQAKALLKTLYAAVLDALAACPDAPYPLLTLPDGSELLVRNIPGQPVRLLDSQIHEWMQAHSGPRTGHESWDARVGQGDETSRGDGRAG